MGKILCGGNQCFTAFTISPNTGCTRFNNGALSLACVHRLAIHVAFIKLKFSLNLEQFGAT